MGKVKSFKEQYSFDERIEEAKSIIAKYPDRVLVIIERYSRTDLPDMEKTKFLVPRDMSMGQFIQQAKPDSWKSSICLCKDYIASNSELHGYHLRIFQGK